MVSIHRFRAAAAAPLAVLLSALPIAAHACATCGCTLSTDAATGYSSESGWRLNLDYTFIDQNALRSGSSRATPQQVVDRPSDASLGGGEIEHGTTNRYLNLTAAYRFDADWGISLLVPYVTRTHDTYGVQLQLIRRRKVHRTNSVMPTSRAWVT